MIGLAPAQGSSSLPPSDLELDSLDKIDLLTNTSEDLEADLPTAARTSAWPREALGSAPELPARSSRAPRAAEIDLPSMEPPAPSSEAEEWGETELPDIPGAVGLPIAGGRVTSAKDQLPDSLDEFDLPARGGDLPDLASWPGRTREVGDGGFDETDLPDLGADLPDLDTGLPIVGGNLPAPNFQLPSRAAQLPATAHQLPMAAAQLPHSAGHLPTATGLGQLPTASGSAAIAGSLGESADPPRARGLAERDSFGGGPADREGGAAERPASVRQQGDTSAFGEVDFGGSSEEDEFDAFPTETAAAKPASPGGSGYGEVALDGGAGGLSLGEEVDRGAVPRGPTAAFSAPVELPSVPHVPSKALPRSRGVGTKTKVIIGVALTVAVAGGALAAVPNVGPYGAYIVLDSVRAGSHRADLERDVQASSARLKKDTVQELEAAFREVNQGRASAPRFAPRAAYAAYLGLLRQVRFGDDSNAVAEAKVLLEGLREADPATPHLELARLAELLSQGKFLDVARGGAAQAGRGTEFAVLVGEAALHVGDLELARSAFEKVLTAGPSARAHFGLARVHQAAHRTDAAAAEVAKSLALTPDHTGAILLGAELSLRDRERDPSLVQLLGGLTAASARVGTSERVRAHTLLGELHLGRSRIKQAEAAFNEALRLDGGDARAQRGLADTLFGSGRYGEALARYEAAAKADPNDLDAELGVVQSKLRLEGLDDAGRILERLMARYPKSTAVAYWEGRAKEASGQRDAAQKSFERAIELGEDRPELVSAFVALTRLLGQAGRVEDAAAVIARAEKRFPENPEVYRALGELSSGRGAYDDAIAQFEKALKLDPQNIGLHFSRGVALRQARRFEEAAAAFDTVEKGEKDFPGLALERGNLFEASGRSEEALRAYESALAQAPKDPDLMLRVGCGKAAAGQSKDARQLLAVVLQERPNSAEVNFCQGLALLKEGTDLPEARRFLERAVGLDSTRAPYYLYVGAVAIELHDYSLASKALDRALELDRTLADAYWQRGVLRVRQGAVKDAETDLRRALELSPSRFEAHAALAEAYMQINKEQDALVEWKAAVSTGHGEPFWHYRYGKLLLDNRQAAEAKPELQIAVDEGSKLQPPPPWLWEAHRNLALTLGRTKEAIPHWQAYLDNAGKNSPYMREALRELQAIVP